MPKYDQQLEPIKASLNVAKRVLVAMPSQLTIDVLSSGLALFLALRNSGKSVEAITENPLQVSQSHLFGVGDVKNQFPPTSGGNLTLTLEGVVIPSGPDAGVVPGLEKLDWYPEGGNLNLVFHVAANQQFKPTRIVPKYEEQNFDLVFVVGAQSLDQLGSIYLNNQQAFSSTQIVNIDNNQNNMPFGHFNVVDKQASCISEMMIQIVQGFGLQLDGDGASNCLVGIYNMTQNLTTRVSPDTFYAVGFAMQSGGSPAGGGIAPQPQVQPQLQPAVPQPAFSQQANLVNPSMAAAPPIQMPVSPQVQLSTEPTQSYAEQHQQDNFTVPPIVNTNDQSPFNASYEERPSGEFASSGSPESPEASPAPDWLTPKIYRGGGLG